MPMGCQIKNAYETVGEDRVMFGIDSPFHHPSVEIQRVLSCGLDEEGLENVFYNNAAKFMGL
jgi:predicted TIM-barrel fold metal-dependent hydrolase